MTDTTGNEILWRLSTTFAEKAGPLRPPVKDPARAGCAGCLGGDTWPANPDSDCYPCDDCGNIIHLQDSAYAVDCGTVCIACGEQRYSPDRRANCFIAGECPPAEDSPSYPLWLAGTR